MVFLLPRDVASYLFEIRMADNKCPVTKLPGEVIQFWKHSLLLIVWLAHAHHLRRFRPFLDRVVSRHLEQ